MVVSKETKEAINTPIDELRTELLTRIKKLEADNLTLISENEELKKQLKETEKNNNKPLFTSMIKKTSEGAPPFSDAETRVINAISAEQKIKNCLWYE